MQIKLVIENFEETEEKDLSVICLKSSSSISSWIVDYYFAEIFSNEQEKSIQSKNIIGSYDMLMIHRSIQPSLSVREFWDLCRKKINKIENVENYNHYLNRCGLMDIIDVFHRCRLESVVKTIILSIKNMKDELDRLFFEYLVELPSTSCGIYDIKTKFTITETKENLLKLINNQEIATNETTDGKNDLTHMLCTYLSLLLDTRNEHALIHCLRFGIQRKELISNRISSYQSFDILDKSYDRIREFFDFIEQLEMIIEENEHSKSEPSVTFHELLELICKQLQKSVSFDQYNSVMGETIEELCQCFQTTTSLMNYTSPIRSASSVATLSGHRFLRSVSYLCAKQTIGLPIMIANSDPFALPMAMNDQATEVKFVSHSNTIRKYRSLDLSIIHEISFESDSIIEKDHPTTSLDKVEQQTIVKRQPLREIDVNSFNIEARKLEFEKNHLQNSSVFTLISDGDKENFPMTGKKRSMISTKTEPPNKKHKKINIKPPEAGQQMITSFFQSTS